MGRVDQLCRGINFYLWHELGQGFLQVCHPHHEDLRNYRARVLPVPQGLSYPWDPHRQLPSLDSALQQSDGSATTGLGGRKVKWDLCGGGFHAARNWLDQECNQLPEPAEWGFTDQWISRLKENSHKYGISLSFFSRSNGSRDYFFPCKVKALTFWYIIEEDCFQPLSE